MALAETSAIDKIEIVTVGDYKMIQLRTSTVITKDGVQIAQSYHRRVIVPPDNWSNETSEVQALCNQYHTSSAITAYRAAIAARG